MTRRRRALALCSLIAALGTIVFGRSVPPDELWRQVEIIRTAHGVPHIRAENLRAAGYALAWLQSEDYGARTAISAMEARGQLATLNGSRDNIESDFLAQPGLKRAIETYQFLE